jgi:hypothetical protein
VHLRPAQIPPQGGRITTSDPHAELRADVVDTVLEGPGQSEPAIRIAAANGGGVPADLQKLVDKIHRNAYKVTDEDISRLAQKYGDDKMFEIIVSAALGAAETRLRIGLAMLDMA